MSNSSTEQMNPGDFRKIVTPSGGKYLKCLYSESQYLKAIGG